MLRTASLSLAALAAACSPAGQASSDAESAASPTPAAVAEPAPVPTATAVADDGRSRYTQLSDCTLLRAAPEEAGFSEHECRGEGGYRLRLTEADLRQNVVVLAPGGGERSLGLPALAGGAFASVGATIEWRGETVGDRFAPRALILRQSVMENPDPRVPEMSYLVVARLAPSSCVVARIRPGPDQNRLARETADRDTQCLS